VLPGEIMRGSIGQMIQFPSWLGKNSTAAKNDRLLQELCRHMHLQYVTVVCRSAYITGVTHRLQANMKFVSFDEIV